MELKDVMDEIAERLTTVTGLKVQAKPAKLISPPAGFVTYPDTINFDETYGRGEDRMDLGVWIAVGDVDSKSARDHLSDYTAGSGPKSVKEVLESGIYTSFDTIRVSQVEFDPVQIGNTTYMGAMFTLDIAGSGS